MGKIGFKFNLCLTYILLATATTSWSAVEKCGFNKKVGNSAISYSVVSTKANGCGVQILSISVTKGGKQMVRYRTDVDTVVHTAFATDFDSDGMPELLLVSREWGKNRGEVVELYKPEGGKLIKSQLPELEGEGSYRGGDSFWIDGKQLVRSFPIYDGELKSGIRTLKYEMNNNKMELYVQNDEPLPFIEPTLEKAPPAQSFAENAPILNDSPSQVIPSPKSSTNSVLSGVEIVENGILIKTVGTVGKFRILKLDKPDRIAIDFVGGKTDMTQKRIQIDKFGILRLRIGKNVGFIRFVFDPKNTKFPKYTVNTVGEGVKIEFQEL